MPHAVPVRTAVGVLFERKKARGGEDLSTANDHRAVVQWRSRHEDRRKELRGELAVHGNARLAVILEAGGALENDESAVLGLADEKRGADQLVDDALEL